MRRWQTLSMSGLSFLEPPEVTRKNDGRPAVHLKFLKSFVTRDEAVTISGNGCTNDWIVIRIRTAGTLQLGWLHENTATPPKSEDFFAFGHVETELFRKHRSQFIENVIGKDNDMPKGAVFEQLVAGSMRNESGNKDVRVQHDSHDTLLKTS